MTQGNVYPTPMTSDITQTRVSPEVISTFPGQLKSSFNRSRLLQVNYKRVVDDQEVQKIDHFLQQGLEDLEGVGINNIVFGLSGGIDSTAVAVLCSRAFKTKTKILAVIVDLNRPKEKERVKRICASAQRLNIDFTVINGEHIRQAMLSEVRTQSPFREINIDTRIINSLIFQVADSMHAAVIAPMDKSEISLGRFTECFYGHLAPIANLYKTEVMDLLSFLGIRNAICDTRPGCEDYWYDDEVLGAGYDVIDPILHLLCDKGRTPLDIADMIELKDIEWLQRIADRVRYQPYRISTRYP